MTTAPHPITGLMAQSSVLSATDHRRGRHAIRTGYDGPEAGLRLIDARHLDEATEAFLGLFGDDGFDVATMLAMSRSLRLERDLPEARRMLRTELDGAEHARRYMAIRALRSVLAEAREA